MINAKDPFPQIKRLFSSLLGIDYKSVNYPETIPQGLQELYLIKDSYRGVNPVNSLFTKQDRLLYPHELKIQNDYFDFLIENQSCWKCDTATAQKNDGVFIHSAVHMDGRQKISDSLDRFLTTYALMELCFCLDFNLNSSFEKDVLLSKDLKIEELWMDEPYAWGEGNRYSFWLIEDSCILMDCSITYLGTNDKQKYELIKSLVNG